jgi:hypothetical protein
MVAVAHATTEARESRTLVNNEITGISTIMTELRQGLGRLEIEIHEGIHQSHQSLTEVEAGVRDGVSEVHKHATDVQDEVRERISDVGKVLDLLKILMGEIGSEQVDQMSTSIMTKLRQGLERLEIHQIHDGIHQAHQRLTEVEAEVHGGVSEVCECIRDVGKVLHSLKTLMGESACCMTGCQYQSPTARQCILTLKNK